MGKIFDKAFAISNRDDVVRVRERSSKGFFQVQLFINEMYTDLSFKEAYRIAKAIMDCADRAYGNDRA